MPLLFFCGCSNIDNLRLENVQRRAAFVCTGAMKRTETVKLSSDLNWDTIESRRSAAKLVLYYKIMNAKVSSLFNKYNANIMPGSNIQERYTFRRIDRVKNIRTRLKMYDLSFFSFNS